VVNSPRAIERSVDKFYTSALLQMAARDAGDSRVRTQRRRDRPRFAPWAT